MTQFLLADQPADGGGPAAPAGPLGPLNGPMGPFFLVAIVVLFFMIVIYPQSRRQKKEQEKMIASIKRGTKIQTAGGIVGTVVSAKDGDPEIVIRSEDTRLRINRNAVAQVLGSDEAETTKI